MRIGWNLGMRYGLVLLLLLSLTGCSVEQPATNLGFQSIELGSTGAAAEPTTQPNTTPEYVLDPGIEIEIEDQQGDGRSVQVEYARVGRGDAFLVISNEQGEILGHSPIDPHTQVLAVSFYKPLASSQVLNASLRWDDGDGVLNPEADAVMLEQRGEDAEEDFYYEVRNG
jgi:hypothetical protein